MNLNYKTSKDYALLKKLLDEGNQVVCIRPLEIPYRFMDAS